MRVASVPLGSKGIDCVMTLNSGSASMLKSSGVQFVVRYLGGITAGELDEILGEGLGCQLVTYSMAPGWLPSAQMGTDDGNVDVARLKALGVPAGMTLWIDLEGSGGDVSSTAAWATARAAVIVANGYIAGLYVGSECVLNSQELYALQHVTRYWRAFNMGIPEPKCGWCQYQTFPPNQNIAGVQVDIDFSQSDYEGRTSTMLVA